MDVERFFFVGEEREKESALSLIHDYRFRPLPNRTMVLCHPLVDIAKLRELYIDVGVDVSRMEIVNDDLFLPHSATNVHSNWLRQQLIKLYALHYSTADYMIIQDADIYPIVDYNWIVDKQVVPTVFSNTSHAPEYYKFAEQILGIPRQTPNCFVTDLAVISKKSWLELKNHIESLHDTFWLDYLIDLFNDEYDRIKSKVKFSEYELIGNWLTYNKDYSLTVEQEPFSITTDNYKDIKKIDPADYNFVSLNLWDADLTIQDVAKIEIKSTGILSIRDFIDKDIQERSTKDKEFLCNIRNDSYSHSCFETGEFWKLHQDLYESIGLDLAPHSCKILDIGTWFGYIPYILKRYGFQTVDSADVDSVINDPKSQLHEYHQYFGIQPFELTIRPLEEFELTNTYDYIFMTNSNFFWNVRPIVNWKMPSENEHDEYWINNQRRVFTETHNEVMSFSPWGVEEFEFFVNNIKRYLNHNGIAVINPHPYIFESVDHPYITQTRDFLRSYQTDRLYDSSIRNRHNTDYIIIRKE